MPRDLTRMHGRPLPRPKIICLTNGSFGENCYILADPDTGEAVLIDPGEEADVFVRRLATEKLRLKEIWLTHAHVDHVAGVGAIVEAFDVPIRLHPGDRPLYDRVHDQAAWLGVQVPRLPPPDHELEAGQALSVGAVTLTVREGPGHSPGGVAFVGEGYAFVGDALFAGSIGRTDLPGGDARTLLDAIRSQLLSLPDDTIAYPGHGPETTIGHERRNNPFLNGAVRIV